MDSFAAHLNSILVDTFWTILKVEEQMLKKNGKINLTINEMHLIEAVGKSPRGRTVSDLALDLGVTRPSVTVAVGKLAKKGCVNKVRAEEDGRVVYVTLTKLGKKMDAVHRFFHESMIRNVEKELTEEEKQLTVGVIAKLNGFFKSKLAP